MLESDSDEEERALEMRPDGKRCCGLWCDGREVRYEGVLDLTERKIGTCSVAVDSMTVK
jgi:hypothetical protein